MKKWLITVIAGLAATVAHGQATVVIPEFQVNTYTTLGQEIPAVGVDSTGNFAVVWTSAGSSGPDNSSRSVQGQLLNADGSPNGGEFQINTYTTQTQQNPGIAMDPSGNFAVVWEGARTDDISGVQGRVLNADGTPNGGEFAVNTYTPGTQNQPQIAMHGSGDFVVVWTGTDPYLPDAEVMARRYDASGAPASAPFQVNSYTTGFQSRPGLGMGQDGSFVVVWASMASPGDASYSIQGQRFSPGGSPAGSEFQVNTYTTDMQFAPSVAVDGVGNFTVVWSSRGSPGSDNSGRSILGQRFAADGTPDSGEFQVNTYFTAEQRHPEITMDAMGNALVVWQSRGPDACDNVGGSIQGQLYDPAGSPVGEQFLINAYTSGDEDFPQVFLDPSGDFTVVWDTNGVHGTDNSFESVRAARQRASAEPGACGGGGGDGGGDPPMVENEIPTLSHGGMIILLALISAGGLAVLRRRA